MNSTSLATVAAGISGIFGLLGFIIYAVMSVSGKFASTKRLTPELAAALKDHGIPPRTIEKMDPKLLRTYLSTQAKVSDQLVREVLAAEVSRSGKIVLTVSILLMILAVVLAITAVPQRTPRSTKTTTSINYSGRLETFVEMTYRPRVPLNLQSEGKIPREHIDAIASGTDWIGDECTDLGPRRILELVFSLAFESEAYNSPVYLLSLSPMIISVVPFDSSAIPEVDSVRYNRGKLIVHAHVTQCLIPDSVTLQAGPLILQHVMGATRWHGYQYTDTQNRVKTFFAVRRTLTSILPDVDWPVSSARLLRTVNSDSVQRTSLVELYVHNLSKIPLQISAISLHAAMIRTEPFACAAHLVAPPWQLVQLQYDVGTYEDTLRGRRAMSWTDLDGQQVVVQASYFEDDCSRTITAEIPTRFDVAPREQRTLGLMIRESQVNPSQGKFANVVSQGEGSLSVVATTPMFPNSVGLRLPSDSSLGSFVMRPGLFRPDEAYQPK